MRWREKREGFLVRTTMIHRVVASHLKKRIQLRRQSTQSTYKNEKKPEN